MAQGFIGLHSDQEGLFVLRVAPRLAAVALAGRIGVVDLDEAGQRARRLALGHRLHDFMLDPPDGADSKPDGRGGTGNTGVRCRQGRGSRVASASGRAPGRGSRSARAHGYVRADGEKPPGTGQAELPEISGANCRTWVTSSRLGRAGRPDRINTITGFQKARYQGATQLLRLKREAMRERIAG